MNSESNLERYQKQMLLKEIGAEGQRRLAGAKILVIGAGGLGCPALQYLAAAGTGCIGIADFDRVEMSNLHRQILFSVADIGASKAETAATRLKALNPDLETQVFNEKIDTNNALDIIARFDLVIDGSDNFPTRYLVNDACVLLDKPLVYGSVFRFEGQLAVFNVPENGRKTNYRDLFPLPPDPGEVADCNEAGVIGVIPGIIGTMQAGEAIKIITGAGRPLANRLLTCNVLENTFYEAEIAPNPDSALQAPRSAEAFRVWDYDWFCNMQAGDFTDIDGADFDQLLLTGAPQVIDVRNRDEAPAVTEFAHSCIPLSELGQNLFKIEKDKHIVVFCQTGLRSITAARMIADKLQHNRVYNLKGGIVKWKTNR